MCYAFNGIDVRDDLSIIPPPQTRETINFYKQNVPVLTTIKNDLWTLPFCAKKIPNEFLNDKEFDCNLIVNPKFDLQSLRRQKNIDKDETQTICKNGIDTIKCEDIDMIYVNKMIFEFVYEIPTNCDESMIRLLTVFISTVNTIQSKIKIRYQWRLRRSIRPNFEILDNESITPIYGYNDFDKIKIGYVESNKQIDYVDQNSQTIYSHLRLPTCNNECLLDDTKIVKFNQNLEENCKVQIQLENENCRLLQWRMSNWKKCLPSSLSKWSPHISTIIDDMITQRKSNSEISQFIWLPIVNKPYLNKPIYDSVSKTCSNVATKQNLQIFYIKIGIAPNIINKIFAAVYSMDRLEEVVCTNSICNFFKTNSVSFHEIKNNGETIKKTALTTIIQGLPTDFWLPFNNSNGPIIPRLFEL
ncbi:hypothetical protein SNEBB_002806 [Seison nebaliae]|nr:hypothetical protein SNEBB_002806 [Seison nebaliae]